MEPKCQACLSSSELFSLNSILTDDVTYADVFFHCTQLNTQFKSESQQLCSDCGKELENIYRFISKALESDRTLNSKASKSDHVEIAVISENNEESMESQLTKEKEEEGCTIYLSYEIQNDLDDSVFRKEECSICSKVFYDEDSYCEHLQRQQKDESNNDANEYKCNKCGKTCKSRNSLKIHLRNVHTLPRFLCEICSITCKSDYGLQRHREQHGIRERKFSCKHCDQMFYTISCRNEHEAVHNVARERRYKCDECEKSFYQRGALNIHKRLHTGELVQCTLCEKRYPRKIDLKIHMRSHTGETPFNCSQCDKGFKNRTHLDLHVRRVHSGAKFECEFCDKQYLDRSSFNAHQNEHKGVFFKCAICNKQNSSKKRLRRHIKTCHQIADTDSITKYIKT